VLSPGRQIPITLAAFQSSLRRSTVPFPHHRGDGPYSYLNVDPEMEKKYPLSDTQVRHAAQFSLYSQAIGTAVRLI
jgi:hypothetical protein